MNNILDTSITSNNSLFLPHGSKEERNKYNRDTALFFSTKIPNKNVKNNVALVCYDLITQKIVKVELVPEYGVYKKFSGFIATLLEKNYGNKYRAEIEYGGFLTVFVPKNQLSFKKVLEYQYYHNINLKAYGKDDVSLWGKISELRVFIAKAVSDGGVASIQKKVNEFNIQKTKALRKDGHISTINKRSVVKCITPHSNRRGLSTWNNFNLNPRAVRYVKPIRHGNRFLSQSTLFSQQSGWKSFSLNEANNSTAPVEELTKAFWKQVAIPQMSGGSQHMLVQLRVQSNNIGHRSLSNLDTITLKDMDKLIEGYVKAEQKALEKYQLENFGQVEINYKTVPNTFKSHVTTSETIDEDSVNDSSSGGKTAKAYNFTRTVLDYDFNNWGKVSKIAQNEYRVKLPQPGLYANVTVMDRENHVTIEKVEFGSSTLLEKFFDTRYSGNSLLPKGLFLRHLSGGTILRIANGQISFTLNMIKVDFITTLNPQREPNNKILTMDLETRNVDGFMQPVCVSVFDGKVNTDFWVSDYASPDLMLEACLRSILIRKYYGYKLYLHNFSHFDGVFLLKILANMKAIEVEVIRRDSRLIKVVVKYDRPTQSITEDGVEKTVFIKTKSGALYKGNLTIYDSMLLLPAGLDKLTQAFNCSRKGMFPLKFLNEAPLNYVGQAPGKEFHFSPDPVSQKQAYEKFLAAFTDYFNNIKDKTNWNLRNELLNYCKQDVISLYEVIVAFHKEIYSKFGINSMDYPTLPSIAFAIYRKNFLKDHKIPIIKGINYADIKKGYYGGYVDVFKASSNLTHSYDVNSLFPAMMRQKFIPVGTPNYFEGAIPLFKSVFGFVEAHIITPTSDKLKHPILPVKYRNPNGVVSTIFPFGSWTGWYFSEELKNAEKYGYKFKVLRGYTFKKGLIFSPYIDQLYNIKKSSTPDSPWYTMSKLLLNSLYGRFGMNPVLDKSIIVDTNKLLDLKKDGKVVITDCLPLGSKSLITLKGRELDKAPNICVAVAAAITSYSRIHMTNYINKYADDICYIDTDGIKITKKLPDKEVGKELGQMKYEGSFKRCVFLAPKVYGGITTNDEMLVKVKGLKTPVNYWELEKLLSKDSLVVHQEKWLRNWSSGGIDVVNQTYTLRPTTYKRNVVRNYLGEIVAVLPYVLHEGVKVIPAQATPICYNPIIPIPSADPETSCEFLTGTLRILAPVSEEKTF